MQILIINIISEGGLFFMIPLVFLLILIIVLFVKELMAKNDRAKTLALISSLSLFAVAWGFLGQTLGLIEGFDTIEGMDDASIQMLAGGLKRSFLPSMFGLFIFLVGRLGMIVLKWKEGNA
ncbi:MAG: hypothetical protein ACI94Y_000828 [Maribacter sp.]|jgi:hypothetical protein